MPSLTQREECDSRMSFLRGPDRCRHDLQNAMPGESVTDIAERWNFNHLGRFSADYRARFGELPSATLQRG